MGSVERTLDDGVTCDVNGVELAMSVVLTSPVCLMFTLTAVEVEVLSSSGSTEFQLPQRIARTTVRRQPAVDDIVPAELEFRLLDDFYYRNTTTVLCAPFTRPRHLVGRAA